MRIRIDGKINYGCHFCRRCREHRRRCADPDWTCCTYLLAFKTCPSSRLLRNQCAQSRSSQYRLVPLPFRSWLHPHTFQWHSTTSEMALTYERPSSKLASTLSSDGSHDVTLVSMKSGEPPWGRILITVSKSLRIFRKSPYPPIFVT